jgi:4-hydroxythreonine-4-phosphate dehydrogenase
MTVSTTTTTTTTTATTTTTVTTKPVLKPLYLTTGEPAGVGPELALAAYQQWASKYNRPIVLVGDTALLHSRATALNLPMPPPEALCHIALAQPVAAGKLNVANAPYVLNTLDAALAAIDAGVAAGMVTAPVHKGIINQAGIGFTGHTEYLAEACCVDEVVMLLADMQAGGLKVALATTHIPLSQVPSAITPAGLANVLDIIHHDFGRYFGKARAHIWVTGLNPHAGEGGHLGREEIDTIEPAIIAAQARGIWATGPYSADTVFCHADIASADVVLAMYHDQGLPVLKRTSFGHAVNITLGLPIVRTSVDHGTALSLAGTGKADVGSLLAAIEAAHHMACAASLLAVATV